MDDYRVQLDVYHGPLDLLLYLIKRDEIDINDIPIAHITEQYLKYVESIKKLDIEMAGEFLVMAATLMQIKSAMLLPPAEVAGEGEDGATGLEGDESDPRFELVQQLLAYKRFKDAAHALEARREEFTGRFPRQPAAFEKDADESAPQPLDLEDVSVWDLLEAFNTLLEQVGDGKRMHEVVSDDTPIELHEADIVDRLQRDGAMSLQEMFIGRRTVAEMIGLFLALLELLRQRKVRAAQQEIGSDIQLVLRPEHEWLDLDGEDEPHPRLEYDPNNPDNFDWPDEQTRQRYTRRIERRARGEVIIEDQEFQQDVAEIEKTDEAEVNPQVNVEDSQAAPKAE